MDHKRSPPIIIKHVDHLDDPSANPSSVHQDLAVAVVSLETLRRT